VIELPRGAESVLVVEDEPTVRQLVVKALERQGYRALSAATPGEALERFGSSEARLDLLVTDVLMPGMSGRELAEKLTASHPSMRVLYTSGYTDDPAFQHGFVGGALLEKPFSPADVLRRVREILDATEAEPLDSPG
jgi:CheY-like chemotaxis protein